MERFEVGDWVVVPPYGVGRITKVTDQLEAAPGRRVYVVILDAAGILLGDHEHGVASVEEQQPGGELVIPVDGKTAKTMRPIVDRERALALRAALDAPLDPSVRLPDSHLDRHRFLQTALAGDLATAIDHLRALRVNASQPTSFVERRAIAALARVVEGELAIALAAPHAPATSTPR